MTNLSKKHTSTSNQTGDVYQKQEPTFYTPIQSSSSTVVQESGSFIRVRKSINDEEIRISLDIASQHTSELAKKLTAQLR